MLKLYDYPASICTQKVRLVLAEKGLEHESRIVDLEGAEQYGREYLAINPNGVVPSLLHDGEVVVDSSAIAEYLDESFATSPLSPTDPLGRARMRGLMRFFEEVPTAAIRYPSWQSVFIPMFVAAGQLDQFRHSAVHHPHHGHFYGLIGDTGFPATVLEQATEDLKRTFTLLNATLADGRSFLVGNEVTLADLVVLPIVVRAEDVNLSSLWSDQPFMAAWYARMQARPSFETVFGPAGVRLRAPGDGIPGDRIVENWEGLPGNAAAA
jgi:glutathione S-transferase